MAYFNLKLSTAAPKSRYKHLSSSLRLVTHKRGMTKLLLPLHQPNENHARSSCVIHPALTSVRSKQMPLASPVKRWIATRKELGRLRLISGTTVFFMSTTSCIYKSRQLVQLSAHCHQLASTVDIAVGDRICLQNLPFNADPVNIQQGYFNGHNDSSVRLGCPAR